MSTAKNNNEEEVDLGSLFVIIGKGFKNFFNFIGSIFKGIFHFLISVLLFGSSKFLLIATSCLPSELKSSIETDDGVFPVDIIVLAVNPPIHFGGKTVS